MLVATGPFEAEMPLVYLSFRNATGVIMTETLRSSCETDATFMAENC